MRKKEEMLKEKQIKQMESKFSKMIEKQNSRTLQMSGIREVGSNAKQYEVKNRNRPLTE
jgi:cell division protein FtsB